MRKSSFIPVLAAAIILTLVSALFSLMNWPFANFLFYSALLLALIVMIMGVMSVAANNQMSVLKKVFWIVAFLVLPLLAGLVYLPVMDKVNE